jgi:hypothetical protein|tara:strand:+ start:322 stop:1071 length:750 start_codon:yes stop_codon:yes gene_type:complete
MEIQEEWEKMSLDLKNSIKTRNLYDFRDWHSVSIIPLYECHLYQEYLDYAKDIYDSLEESEKYIWEFCMSHTTYGYTFKHHFHKKHSIPFRHFTTNPYNLKSNHHFFKYQTHTKNKITEFDRIVELGGGCGDFCKFVMNMGYTGDYVIIDLPVVTKIQKQNLAGYDVRFTSAPVHYRENTLFVSTWAISECPIEWRNEIISKLNPSNWLISYQSKFNEVDNEKYFKDFEGVREKIPWIHWDGGSKYILK